MLELIDVTEPIGHRLLKVSATIKLAGSYSFLTMTSVSVAGWLMVRQAQAANQLPSSNFKLMKQSSPRFFLDFVVPAGRGLAASAEVTGQAVLQVPASAFSA